MWSPDRRALLRMLAAGLLLPAAGCGFRPLYGRGGPGANAPVEALRSVRVDVIADRPGQILRNELSTLLNPRGVGAPDLYGLKVVLDTELREVAIRKDETATRNDLTVTADYVLRSLEDERVLTRGRVRSVNAYNIVASDYANVVAESDALQSNLRQLALQLQARLAVHFERQAQNLPAGAGSRT